MREINLYRVSKFEYKSCFFHQFCTACIETIIYASQRNLISLEVLVEKLMWVEMEEKITILKLRTEVTANHAPNHFRLRTNSRKYEKENIQYGRMWEKFLLLWVESKLFNGKRCAEKSRRKRCIGGKIAIPLFYCSLAFCLASIRLPFYVDRFHREILLQKETSKVNSSLHLLFFWISIRWLHEVKFIFSQTVHRSKSAISLSTQKTCESVQNIHQNNKQHIIIKLTCTAYSICLIL